MDITFSELAKRSHVPGPVTESNSYRPRTYEALKTYDGQALTVFLNRCGAEPFSYRKVLLENQIGDPFAELQPGIVLKVETNSRG